MPVSITPGQTQFILTPVLASSIAISRVKTTRPPFALPYAVESGKPTSPFNEEILITLPDPSSTIPGTIYLHINQGPFRSVSRTLSHSSSVVLS